MTQKTIESLLPRKPFYVLRHGETDWNLESRLQGATDIPLNKTGVKQAQNAAENFKDIQLSHIYTSHLQRAKHTANIIGKIHNIKPYIQENLQERTFGIADGMLWKDIHQKYPQKQTTNPSIMLTLQTPQCETTEIFHLRIINSFNEALQNTHNHPPLFVTHGGVIASLTTQLMNIDSNVENATPYLVSPTKNGWEIIRH